MCGCQPVSACGSKDVYSVVLVQAELSVTSTDLKGQLLVVMEAYIFVAAEFEICPLLVNLCLFPIYHLLDLLRLLMCLDELPRSESLRIAKFLGASLDDVKNGRNIF